MQISLHCNYRGAKQKEGGEGVLGGLWNRAGVQFGNLVGRNNLSVSFFLAGGTALCGSVGQWCCWRGGCGGGGRVGGVAGCVTAAVTASSSRSRGGGLFFFGLLACKLCDAEDKLQAAQFDVASVVEQGGSLPSCPTASY